jgi:predicted NAD-dependent protein-ADP-ribosyltransferase YbiA (DUF1768 family)
MRAIFKDGLIVLVPQTADETEALVQWKLAHAGHVLWAPASDGTGLELRDLGSRAEACREPINVISNSPDPEVRIIGNLSAAPFELDGRRYVSVESFWQGLKFEDDGERQRIAACDGPRARSEGARRGYGAAIRYGDRDVMVGTHDHWRLMERACRAKFDQNADARAALLATGNRPLTHVVRRDSKAIPGVIMADIWMRIRADLRRHADGSSG